jgi:hypothetical protein
MLLLFLVGALVANRAEAVAQPGDIVVGEGTLMWAVNPTTGVRTILSDFSNAAQGPTGASFRVATGPGGVIYTTDGASDQSSKLFQVFSDGTRVVVSDATNAAQGLPWHTTDTPAVDTDGSILVSDRGIGGGGNDSGLWRVNATTGFRTKLFSFGGHPEGITLDSLNRILLGDAEGGTDCHTFGGCGALYNVDRVTAALTTLSDFGNPAQGPLGEDAGFALAKDTDGTILVSDPFAPPCPQACGVLFRWDPATSTRSYVTKAGDPSQGDMGFFRMGGVAVAANGTIFISPCNGSNGFGAICTVNRTTGVRTVFSDFGNPLQGPVGFNGASLAILEAGGAGGGGNLTALSPARVFLGLKNGDDYPVAVDVRVEVRKNGVLVTSGLNQCVRGLVRDPAKAMEVDTPFDAFAPVPVGTGDVLALKVLTRVGTNPDNTRCTGPLAAHANAVGLRLYYDSPSRNSRFDATITPNPSQDLFLHSNGTTCPAGGGPSAGATNPFLDASAPANPGAKCKDSGGINFSGGNLFKEIGTWALTLP